MLNTAYGKTMFWDGRAPSLEGQAQGPIQNPIEMGKQSYKEIVDRLRKIPGYIEQFQKVFGTNVTLDGMAKAIATFERVAALSGNSQVRQVQRRRQQGPVRQREARHGPVRPDAQHRRRVQDATSVRQKAKCTLCHAGFNFTDEQFHNLGVGWDEKTGKFADLGRWAIDPDRGQDRRRAWGRSRRRRCATSSTPRPTCTTAAWRRSKQVVDHYDKGGTPNPALDTDMKKLEPDRAGKDRRRRVHEGTFRRDQEARRLLPKLPPDSDGKSPDPRAALTPPAKAVAAVSFHPAATR